VRFGKELFFCDAFTGERSNYDIGAVCLPHAIAAGHCGRRLGGRLLRFQIFPPQLEPFGSNGTQTGSNPFLDGFLRSSIGQRRTGAQKSRAKLL
jgi:hypothetical protein